MKSFLLLVSLLAFCLAEEATTGITVPVEYNPLTTEQLYQYAHYVSKKATQNENGVPVLESDAAPVIDPPAVGIYSFMSRFGTPSQSVNLMIDSSNPVLTFLCCETKANYFDR